VRVHADAPDSVRRLIREAGGLSAPPGLDHPWDVAALAPHATARILIVHGRGDETIGVRHARELAAAFAATDGREGRRACYHELPQAGHDLNWPHVWELVTGFIQQTERT
jgi:predicted esterase